MIHGWATLRPSSINLSGLNNIFPATRNLKEFGFDKLAPW
jgi:hypothetical protein